MAQKNIFINRHFRDKRQFLINDGNARLFAIANARKFLYFTAKENIPAVRTIRINPAQYFHQSGFTSPVLPHKTMNLTLGNPETDIVQCLHARELFGNGLHLEYGRVHANSVSWAEKLHRLYKNSGGLSTTILVLTNCFLTVSR